MIPDLSVLWVIVFVLILSVVVDRGLLRPLLRVMQAREQAVRSARELAEASAAKAKDGTAVVEAKTLAARTELYRQMDEMRKQALERRGELMEQTRREVEAAGADASASVKLQAKEARARLEREADALAAMVAERVLGRKVS